MEGGVALALNVIIRRFKKDERGLALTELAFLLPVLLMMFYGIIEVSRYIQMHQKVDNAGRALVDLLNQNLSLTAATVNDLMATVPDMVVPFDSNGVGVIVTSIKVPEGLTEPTTLWQMSYGDIRNGSRVSAGKDEPVYLPQLKMVERDQVLTVELFLAYRPLLDTQLTRTLLGLEEQGVYKVNLARPRYGAFEFEPR